jgi:hypothetical protein
MDSPLPSARNRALKRMAKLRALAEDLRAPFAERQHAWAKYQELQAKWVRPRAPRMPRTQRTRRRPVHPSHGPGPQYTYDASRAAAQAEAVAVFVKLAVDFLKFVIESEPTRT